MSGFKFGTGAGTGSFNFGTSTATTTPAGFSFGTAPNTATTAPAPAVGAPAVGAPAVGAPAAAIQNPGFSFGQTAPAQPKSAGFGFGTPQASAAPAPAPAPAAAPGSFNFGVTPTPNTGTATSAAVPGFNFGAAAKPAGTGLLGQQTTPAPSTGLLGTQTAPAATGALFVSQPATTTGVNLSLGGLLGPQSVSAPTGLLGAQTSLAPSVGLLGGQTTTSTLAGLLGAAATASNAGVQPVQPQTGFGTAGFKMGGTAAGTSTVAASSTGPTLSLGLGQATTPLQVASISQTVPAAGGIKLGLGAATTSTTSILPGGLSTTSILPGGLSTTRAATTTVSLSTTTTTSSSKPTAPTLNYRQLEEAINKWTLDLEEQEKIFLQQATQVNAWDRLLIDNGEKITQLNTDVERVKIDQQRLDQELDFIRTQQKELEELLNPLEQAVEQLPPINYQQHADLEREHTYKLAENIDAQLKRMVQDLKEIIEHLNTSNSGQDNNDPVVQIAKILNAHMDSLQWVDQNTGVLQRRVDEVAKLVKLQKKEQEKNFRLAYE